MTPKKLRELFALAKRSGTDLEVSFRGRVYLDDIVDQETGDGRWFHFSCAIESMDVDGKEVWEHYSRDGESIRNAVFWSSEHGRQTAAQVINGIGLNPS